MCRYNRYIIIKYHRKKILGGLETLYTPTPPVTTPLNATNFGHKQLNPLELLNHLHKTNLTNMFPNLCIALRIFLTIP